MTSTYLAALCVGLACLSGCTNVFYMLPNSRPPTVQSAETLQRGETGVEGGLGVRQGNPQALGYQGFVGMRRGLTDALELQAAASALHFRSQRPSLVGPGGESNSPVTYGLARLGLQHEIRRFFAYDVGFGGGGSRLGGFLSWDAGLLLSYPGDHLVPMFRAGGFVTVPVTAPSVSIVEPPGVVGPPVVVDERVYANAGYELSGGFRVPIPIRNRASVRLELPIVAGVVQPFEIGRSSSGLSALWGFGAVSLEIIFGGRRD